MSVNLSELKVGEEVAVARSGNYRVMSQGVYTVAKADKKKIVLWRKVDGYERIFSVITGREKSTSSTGHVDRNTWIESIETLNKREAEYREEWKKNDAWETLATAVKTKNIETIEKALAAVKALVGVEA